MCRESAEKVVRTDGKINTVMFPAQRDTTVPTAAVSVDTASVTPVLSSTASAPHTVTRAMQGPTARTTVLWELSATTAAKSAGSAKRPATTLWVTAATVRLATKGCTARINVTTTPMAKTVF